MTKEKIIIGISGGVDSAVAALLLKQQGYQVEALFMKNWEEDDTQEYCSAAVDLADAQQVCDRLDIPLHSVNFASEYWDRVFEYFLEEYRLGRTPNPDIMCNREIKFKAFLEYAIEMGASRIATGHYVQNKLVENGTQLLRGLDENKDQSYFLYALNSYQLSKALFPVGHLHKSQVRQLAEENGFDVFNKKDSTGICFIGERKFKDFLQQFLPAQPGKIQTLEGITIGSHSGLMYYTMGQRQGLGIGGLQNASEQPWFVSGKDLDNNILIVTQGHDHPALFNSHCEIEGLHWINKFDIQLPFSCTAKIRYRQQDQHCTITTIESGIATVEFKQPQRAITPGQALVLYDDQVCLGGGTINKAFNLN
ncbi:MAG: tRNA 2-thiouridine(34) synthase MnmA [Gammaproteobacteria bacterium]|jgi:tRNA-specific 2-thiouridylase|nr:tRNA 2-thiouridine(34) synthase MnmA [Gammaproteobacteria bacterium]MBT3723167.1 tRNA 2-thiouridine(34) synthase MnmA [Gammaproteobacteria bacterium]MBT4196191.1 tRNA 2-thiouridine(34) synthase MnmA [Gammaproteobacteria bacterium]MBT4448318.1 tRNA 2-thiouridine(34) synthase MnmA [Gammaproteobacteria bacterium]MBT4862703.1 tRNA 2-thiouridine(34) synthase MnmA [Gammaproteobacteria bacterium]